MREHATDRLQIEENIPLLPFLSMYHQPKMFQTGEITSPVSCSIHLKRSIAGIFKSKGESHASVKCQTITRGEEEQAGKVEKGTARRRTERRVSYLD